jgi:hypothetical protein
MKEGKDCMSNEYLNDLKASFGLAWYDILSKEGPITIDEISRIITFMVNIERNFVTVEEASKMLNCSKSHVYDLIKKGVKGYRKFVKVIAHHKAKNSTYLIHKDEIEWYLKHKENAK